MNKLIELVLIISFLVYSLCLQCKCNNKICPCRQHSSFIESKRIVFKVDNTTSNI